VYLVTLRQAPSADRLVTDGRRNAEITWRDSEVASRHASVNPDIGAQAYGQALLGAETSAAIV
jgi:hypothetical protein